MSPQDLEDVEELPSLRRALAIAERELQSANQQIADLESRHEALISDMGRLLTRIANLARYSPVHTLCRHREILAPEILATRAEDYPKEYAASLALTSIAALADLRLWARDRQAIEFSRIVETAIHDLRNQWPWPQELDWLPLELRHPSLYQGTELAPFEISVGSLPYVFVEPRRMVAAIRYLLVYALYRTKRSPRVLRIGSCMLSIARVLYITDSDEDVRAAAPERIQRWPHTVSPEYAVFCHTVQAHGGMVWKQRVGAERGAILFSLPGEPTETMHGPHHPLPSRITNCSRYAANMMK